MRLAATLTSAAVAAAIHVTVIGAADAQSGPRSIIPPFTIWDVELGTPVSEISEIDVIEIACGTNGGPASRPLKQFEDFAACKPEATGLYEVTFGYDDEAAYVEVAIGSEYTNFRGGTTVHSQPVIISVLIDEAGIVRGKRIQSDPTASIPERRLAVTLMRIFEARYQDWDLDCTDFPLSDGEQPIGNRTVKRTCFGNDASASVRLDGSYFRKRGQRAVNQNTQQVNFAYFESLARLEVIAAPFELTAPLLGQR